MSRDLKDTAYGELARIGKALAHAHRLELLDLLAQGPRRVDDLARGTARSRASTSQHLQILAQARLVTRTRDGVHVVYGLADGVERLLVALEDLGMVHLAELPAARDGWLETLPTVHRIEAEELERALAADTVVLLDVRPAEEFRHGHIDGAINTPLDRLGTVLGALPRDREIIACCRGRWCTWADEAVQRLRAEGFRARRFEGSVAAWAVRGGAVRAP